MQVTAAMLATQTGRTHTLGALFGSGKGSNSCFPEKVIETVLLSTQLVYVYIDG